MADPRFFYDRKLKRITRSDPPELMHLLEPIKGTNLVMIPKRLLVVGSEMHRFVSVQVSAENQPSKE